MLGLGEPGEPTDREELQEETRPVLCALTGAGGRADEGRGFVQAEMNSDSHTQKGSKRCPQRSTSDGEPCRVFSKESSQLWHM